MNRSSLTTPKIIIKLIMVIHIKKITIM